MKTQNGPKNATKIFFKYLQAKEEKKKKIRWFLSGEPMKY